MDDASFADELECLQSMYGDAVKFDEAERRLVLSLRPSTGESAGTDLVRCSLVVLVPGSYPSAGTRPRFELIDARGIPDTTLAAMNAAVADTGLVAGPIGAASADIDAARAGGQLRDGDQ